MCKHNRRQKSVIKLHIHRVSLELFELMLHLISAVFEFKFEFGKPKTPVSSDRGKRTANKYFGKKNTNSINVAMT